MMNDEKNRGLNLLPLNIQMFAIGDPVEWPAYAQHYITGKHLLPLNTSNKSFIVQVYDDKVSTHKINGISKNSGYFNAASGPCMFNISITTKEFDLMGTSVYTVSHVFNDANYRAINALPAGTYYIFVDGASRFQFEIYRSSEVVVTKNFMRNKQKSDISYFKMTWKGTTQTEARHVSWGLTSVSKYNSGDFYPYYGYTGRSEYIWSSLDRISYHSMYFSGSIDDLYDGAQLYLMQYESGNWEHVDKARRPELFEEHSANCIVNKFLITVRNAEFRFSNPYVPTLSVQHGINLSLPIPNGYSSIKWQNTLTGLTNGGPTTSFKLGAWANMTNNTYWFDMVGQNEVKKDYTYSFHSQLPGGEQSTVSNTYQINLTQNQTKAIYPPSVDVNAGTKYGEFSFNNWSPVTTSGTDKGGTAPYFASKYILNIPANSYGNISASAIWDYKKYNLDGQLSAINTLTKVVDIHGTKRDFDGYSFTFNDMNGQVSAVDFQSSASLSNYTYGLFEATTKPGYESKGFYVIEFPFSSDGSVTQTLNPDIFCNFTSIDLKTSGIPQPLQRNSGVFKYDYNIPAAVSGDIIVGMATTPSDFPIYVKMGDNISSFNYNSKKYTSSSTPNYLYSGNVYHKLEGATFNVKEPSKQFSLTDIVITRGYSHQSTENIVINGIGIVTDAEIESNAFYRITEPSLVEYTIKITSGAGISDSTITPSSYNITTDTVRPVISYTVNHGYNNVLLSGSSILGVIPFAAGAIKEIDKTNPTYLNYDYHLTASKDTYTITKNTTTPYGIKDYAISISEYQVSEDDKVVTVTHTLNDGFEFATPPPGITTQIQVGPFIDKTGVSLYAKDQTLSSFKIPANTIGNVTTTFPVPSRIEYSIDADANSTNVKGIDSFEILPLTSTYETINYSINELTKQKVTTGIGLKSGYEASSNALIVTGPVGFSSSDRTWDSFNIDINSFGNIIVKPNVPNLINYTIELNIVNIAGQTVSGLNGATLDKYSYTVEDEVFTPKITPSYINSGFSGITSNVTEIQKGSFGNKIFDVTANVVEFDITVTKGTGIKEYNYNDASATYNVFSRRSILIDNIIVVNHLFNPVNDVTRTMSDELGSFSIPLSTTLKTNSISLNTLPEGYNSNASLDLYTYTTTQGAAKKINATFGVSLGYSLSENYLEVSGIKTDAGLDGTALTISKTAFTIPADSWGDIVVSLPVPVKKTYNISMSAAPTGVNSNYGISPASYTVTDFKNGATKTFTITLSAADGYYSPTWKLNGVLQSGNTFTMNSFTETPPSITVQAGAAIKYDMTIVKGSGISSFKYGTTEYLSSSIVDTYTVENTKTIKLTNIKVLNNLWKSLTDYNAITVTEGMTGNKEHTIQTTLKTNTIKTANISTYTGIATMTLSQATYTTFTEGTVTVNVSYTMDNDAFYPPASFTVTGSLDGLGKSVSIVPINGTSFNIPVNTYGELIVTPAMPVRKTYSITTAGIDSNEINKLSYTILSQEVTSYVISEVDRVVNVAYSMKPGYYEPTDNLGLSEGSAVVVNSTSFTIPKNTFGNIIVTPGTPAKKVYNISAVSTQTGINSISVLTDTYSINHTSNIGVKIEYDLATGWKLPTEYRPTITGSATTMTDAYNFNITKNNIGDIVVTAKAPTAIEYAIDINSNPKLVAINKWSVSPTTYKVTDTYPKTFTITVEKADKYNMPTWSINGVVTTNTSFVMNAFTETVPKLIVTTGAPTPQNISLNYADANSGISVATITPTSYNVETDTFTPVESVTEYSNGYGSGSGYTITPPITQITKGSTGHRVYKLKANAITYTITKTIGTGISSANLFSEKIGNNPTVYNIENTAFSLVWKDVKYVDGYDSYILTGHPLSVASGTTGPLAFGITGVKKINKIYIQNPSSSNIKSFEYKDVKYEGYSTIEIGTFDISSQSIVLTLTDVKYVDGYDGPSEISFGTFNPAETFTDITRSLGDVNNIYIDVNPWRSPLLDNVVHYKVKSFEYNGVEHTVGERSKVLVGYFANTDSAFNNDLKEIKYEDGYEGPEEYEFGYITPSPISTDDVTFVMGSTTLIDYNIYIQKDNTVVKYEYKKIGESTTTPISDNQLIVIPFTVQSKFDAKIYNIEYVTGTDPNATELNILAPNSSEVLYNLTRDVGSESDPIIISANGYIDYNITIAITDNSNLLHSYKTNICYKNDTSTKVSKYNLISPDIIVTITDIEYKQDFTYVGPSSYGYSGEAPVLYGHSGKTTKTGVNLSWEITSGKTGNRTFSLNIDDIVSRNEFKINYNNTIYSKKDYISDDYISAVVPKTTYYTFGDIKNITNGPTFFDIPTSVMYDGTDTSLDVAIKSGLENGNPIHASYTTTGSGVNINKLSYGDKEVNIVWSDIIHNMTIKDHYVINDVYGINNESKVSPLTNLKEVATIYVVQYLMSKNVKKYAVTPKAYARTGWSLISAGDVSVDVSNGNITGFNIPGGYYGPKETLLVYKPNTYIITLSKGSDADVIQGSKKTISILYDHEIEKWSKDHIPSRPGYIFKGFKDGNGIEKITYGGLYIFDDYTYSANVSFSPIWTKIENFPIKYNSEKNISIDTNQMEAVSGTEYFRFKENYLSPILLQNIILNSTNAIVNTYKSTSSKYVFNLLSEYIKVREVTNLNNLKNHKVLEFKEDSSSLSNQLDVYLSNTSNNMSGIISKIESVWDGLKTSLLADLSITRYQDLWLSTDSVKRASSDIFRIAFRTKATNRATYKYWIFDVLIKSDSIQNTLQSLNEQDMFLISTKDSSASTTTLKEVMKIVDKDGTELYDRTPYVIENVDVLTNWESIIPGVEKTADVYGLLPVNKDKTYAIDLHMKTVIKSDIIKRNATNTLTTNVNENTLTQITLPYNSNVRVGKKVSNVGILNYAKYPIHTIYSNTAINNMSNLNTLNSKSYTLENGKLTVAGLDTILGLGANARGALSSDGEFLIPTLYYRASINNESTKHSVAKTTDVYTNTREYVYTPANRNIGNYVVQGPVLDSNNQLSFYIDNPVGILNVYISKFSESNNSINGLDHLLTARTGSNLGWFILGQSYTNINSNTFYTIVIETADKYMYNNLLVYKMFS